MYIQPVIFLASFQWMPSAPGGCIMYTPCKYGVFIVKATEYGYGVRILYPYPSS